VGRRILRVAWILLQGAAWSAFLAAVALFAFEEAGGWTRLLQRELARRLGSLADCVRVDRVRLKWFEPALALDGVELHADTPERGELLRLASLHVGLEGYRDTSVRSIRAEDGKLRLSSALFETIEHLQARLATGGPEPSRPLPPILADEIEVEIEHEHGPIRGGRTHLVVESTPAGELRFRGSIAPEWIDTRRGIEFEGRRDGAGVLVRAVAEGLLVGSANRQMAAALPALPLTAWSGRVAFDASIHLDPSGSAPWGELRARIEGGSLAWRADQPPLEAITLEVGARGEAAELGGLAALSAWSARASARASWVGKPLVAYALLGSEPGGEPELRLFGRAQELALDASTLEALGGSPALHETFAALEPNGTADTSFDLALRRSALDGTPRWKPSVAVHMRNVGRSGLTFQGFRSVTGERLGLPVPCTSLTGQALLVHDGSLALPLRLALVDFVAQHPSGVVHGWSQLTAVDRAGALQLSEFDLVFDAPDVAIDDRLRRVLETSPITKDIIATFDPRGGTAHTTWRFRDGPETGGLSAQGRVTIEGTTLRWREIPVPLEGTSGELELLWAKRASFVSDQAQRVHRPIGVAYSFENDRAAPERQGARAVVRGFARQEELGQSAMASDTQRPWIQEIAVDIPDLRLRGADFDELGRRFPELRAQRDEHKASGSMRVAYHGARPWHDLPWTSDIEAVPGELQIQPSFFQRNTQDIRGRILVRVGGEPLQPVTTTRLDLSGRWPGDVVLAVHGLVSSNGATDVRVSGAGIDPTNNAFQGALLNVLAVGEERSGVRLDLSQSRLAGRVDFGLRTTSVAGEPVDRARVERSTVVRIYLRDNVLGHGELELGSLHGVLEQSGSVLESPSLTAVLGGHGVELRNVLVFPLEEAEGTPGVDALLHRAGYPAGTAGLALQAELHTRDLPLDQAHVAPLLVAGAMRADESAARANGSIDVLGARILLTGPRDRPGILLVRGPFELRDLALKLGLPIQIHAARLELEEFAVEEQRVRGWARVLDMDAAIAGRALSGTSLIVGYVDGRLTLDALAGDFENDGQEGRLVSLGRAGAARRALGVDLAEPHRFDIALQIQSVPVDRLLRGLFPSSIADEGFLDAELEIAGRPDDVLGLHGRGNLHLKEGKLWSIPVVRALFSQLGFDQTLSFDELRARFELRDGVLLTPLLEIKSPLVNLVGDGWIDLDGRVHFDLEARYGLLDRLGILNRILYWMNRKIWRVAVRGDINRPQVIIRTSLFGFLRRGAQAERRELPVPELSPLPARF
jgi:hypothetical protein